jgi:hypothetical protein
METPMPPTLTTRAALNGAWILTGGLYGLDAAWLWFSGMSITTGGLFVALGGGGALLALSQFYTRARPDQKLAGLAEAAAFLMLFTLPLATASYLATAIS